MEENNIQPNQPANIAGRMRNTNLDITKNDHTLAGKLAEIIKMATNLPDYNMKIFNDSLVTRQELLSYNDDFQIYGFFAIDSDSMVKGLERRENWDDSLPLPPPTINDYTPGKIDLTTLSGEGKYFLVNKIYKMKVYTDIYNAILNGESPPVKLMLKFLGFYVAMQCGVLGLQIQRGIGEHTTVSCEAACLGMLIEALGGLNGIHTKQFYYYLNILPEMNKKIVEYNRVQLEKIANLSQYKNRKKASALGIKKTGYNLINSKSVGGHEIDSIIARTFLCGLRMLEKKDLDKTTYGYPYPSGGDDEVKITLHPLFSTGVSERKIYTRCGLRIYSLDAHTQKDTKTKEQRMKQEGLVEERIIKEMTSKITTKIAFIKTAAEQQQFLLQKNIQVAVAPVSTGKAPEAFRQYNAVTDLEDSSDPSFLKYVLENGWDDTSMSTKYQYLERVLGKQENIWMFSKALSSMNLPNSICIRVQQYLKPKKWNLMLATIRAYNNATSDVIYYNSINKTYSSPIIYTRFGWEFKDNLYNVDELYKIIATEPFYISNMDLNRLDVQLVDAITTSRGGEVDQQVLNVFNNVREDVLKTQREQQEKFRADREKNKNNGNVQQNNSGNNNNQGSNQRGRNGSNRYNNNNGNNQNGGNNNTNNSNTGNRNQNRGRNQGAL